MPAGVYGITIIWDDNGRRREQTQTFDGKWADLEDHAEATITKGFYLELERGKRYIPAHRVLEVEIFGKQEQSEGEC